MTDRYTHTHTDRQTDRQTDTGKQYAPDLSMRGHKNLENKTRNILKNGW